MQLDLQSQINFIANNLPFIWEATKANAPYLSGVFIPPIVTILKRDVSNSNIRYLLSGAVCVAFGFLLKWNDLVNGTGQDFLFTTSLLFAESQSLYKLYFDGSWVELKLNQLIPSKKEESVVVNPEALNLDQLQS